MPVCTTPDPCRPVREYGCVFCQRRRLQRYWHREGFDAEYEDHLYFQSKHGWRERFPIPNEVLERLAKESP